jgi:hypothetical protein
VSGRLLEFTVDKTLCGHGDEIKEFTLGLEVFGRKASFDPQSDSIVRVQARKLRERLLGYYESDGAGEIIRIEYKKGHLPPGHPPHQRRGTGARSGTCDARAVRFRTCRTRSAAPPACASIVARMRKYSGFLLM